MTARAKAWSEPQPESWTLLRLPDIADAVRSGECASFAPEDVKEWVQRVRAEALAAQQPSKTAPLHDR